MPKAWENWLGLVNSLVYYVRQTRKNYLVLPYPVDFKAPGSFKIHWVKQYLVNAVLCRIKDL